MTRDTYFLVFWRELSALFAAAVPLALAARAWRITRAPAEAAQIIAPTMRGRK